MAPPLVPPPILRPGRPLRGPALSCRHRRVAALGLVPAPATLAALGQATRLGPAAREAALAPGRETQLALAPVVAVAATEVVGTKSRFGGE
jgi:hypothetical protein